VRDEPYSRNKMHPRRHLHAAGESTINGVLTITDDAAFSPQEVALTARAPPIGAAVKDHSGQRLVHQPGRCTASAIKTVSVKNSSPVPLTNFFRDRQRHFTATGAPEALAAGATCTLSLTSRLHQRIHQGCRHHLGTPLSISRSSASPYGVLPVIMSPTSLHFLGATRGDNKRRTDDYPHKQ